MKFTLIVDSCADLKNSDLTTDKLDFFTVPLTLTLGETDYVDEEDLDTRAFTEKMRAAKTLRSACPSPEAFMDIMRERDNIIIVTLSSKLSGTHGSAVLAVENIMAEFPDKKVYLLDSLSAAAGMANICMRIAEMVESGESYEEIIEKLPALRSGTRVRFLLQDLSNLVKTGRMKKTVGAVLGVTPLKLVCGDNGEGEIKKYGMALGTRKGLAALAKFVDTDTVTIAHANNESDANALREMLEKNGVKNIKILLMRGLSTFYANDKGIVIAF
ncbi:MAG: DegV family protein [Firmicutes bacterium]|nr:DegV family protein [Bacillota bacterium]